MAPRGRAAEAAEAAAPAAPAQRGFTWQQLAQHNREGDAYVAIHGNVYDVTQWMYQHPGGSDVLRVAAGRDVSQVFPRPTPTRSRRLIARIPVAHVDPRLSARRSAAAPPPTLPGL